jgi:cathepsin A (carboxypeptidase C)
MIEYSQPVGVGLSLLKNGSNYPTNLEESSPDLIQMLQIWYGDIFPQFGKVPLYLAGESFGGRYVPRYAADIVRQKQTRSAGALQSVELGGVILVNALVDSNPLSVGHYDLFCTDQPPNVVRFNETTCRAMGAAVPECERLASICQRTLDAQVCLTAQNFCMENLEVYFQAEVAAHRLSPYDRKCYYSFRAHFDHLSSSMTNWLTNSSYALCSTTKLPRASIVRCWGRQWNQDRILD